MNLFPAVVHTSVDGKLYEPCKVVFDGRDTAIWLWDHRSRQPVLVAHAKGRPQALVGSVSFAGRTKPGTAPWRLATKDAGMVTFQQANGCGCSEPLKRYTPQLSPGARRLYTSPEVVDGEPRTDTPTATDAS